MPYIPQPDRSAYDPDIARLAASLARQTPEKRKGHANYVITQILRKAWGLEAPGNESYSSYADVIGSLECAKLELYRHWVGPYEDKAIERHGDLID